MKILKNFFLLMLLSTMVHASSLPHWSIVPAESSLTFTATQNGAPVKGSFTTFTGDILFDPVNYQQSSVHITIDMHSVAASYADLSKTLLSADWFNVALFPKAEFKSTQFNKIDAQTYEALGVLTIRDKSAPITLTFTFVEAPKAHALVEGHTVIKRTTFGVGEGEWSSTKEIKDDVSINFKIVALRKD